MTEKLRHTQLHQWHIDHDGRMVSFAGWEMPVQYSTGPIKEHCATRQAAGLFDIDHMGQIEIRGPQSEEFVNHLVTFNVSQMKMFDAHYALMCYNDGGVVDDVFVYKLPDPTRTQSDFYFFLAVNASNRQKDLDWIQAHMNGFDVTVRDVSDETFMLALQGPLAPAILEQLTRADLTAMPRFSAVTDSILDEVPTIFGRTGYTGEDGFELFFPASQAVRVWESILDTGESQGLLPIGLAARDSLRFEAAMPLYGHELAADHTPLESRLGFAVSFEKEFIGREALLKQKMEGPDQLLVGFEMIDRAVPRHGYQVMYEGQVVGKVTSGMYSPTTDRYLGMAWVPREAAAINTEIQVAIHNKPKTAIIVRRPFYTPAYRRNMN